MHIQRTLSISEWNKLGKRWTKCREEGGLLKNFAIDNNLSPRQVAYNLKKCGFNTRALKLKGAKERV